jgi:DNA-binding NarL/FixJ family response regulator
VRKKIVVLDDSEICREVARLALERRGHEVILLESPFGLPKLLAETKPDMLLLDVNMPALGGEKVAQIMRRNFAEQCRVVFLSDRPADELARLVVQTGADGYVQKTNDLLALGDAVERFFS